MKKAKTQVALQAREEECALLRDEIAALRAESWRDQARPRFSDRHPVVRGVFHDVH